MAAGFFLSSFETCIVGQFLLEDEALEVRDLGFSLGEGREGMVGLRDGGEECAVPFGVSLYA